MAGASKHRQEVLDLQRAIRDLERENADLKVKVALLDPEAALADIPPIVEKCTQQLCDQVLAIGAQGLGHDEIKAKLGIKDEDWEEWCIKHPQFAAAAARAKTMGRAYWSKMARESIERGDNRFPVNTYSALMVQMFSQGSGKHGDASKLLVLDLATVSQTPPRRAKRPAMTGK
ncbi:MAG: hypothetical protein GC155_06200 [Alphaproteobacteria bacterium]|nr:hypothetical protein [Alphaproteobacteria bacterium]